MVAHVSAGGQRLRVAGAPLLEVGAGNVALYKGDGETSPPRIVVLAKRLSANKARGARQW